MHIEFWGAAREPFEAAVIDAVVLNHAHLDHTGNLPSLVRSGFRGGIWTTHATADLCGHMLMDSAHIRSMTSSASTGGAVGKASACSSRFTRPKMSR